LCKGPAETPALDAVACRQCGRSVPGELLLTSMDAMGTSRLRTWRSTSAVAKRRLVR